MVAIPRTRARPPASHPAGDPAGDGSGDRAGASPESPAGTRAGAWSARPLPYAEAAALVVPHPVLVPTGGGWESAWLLACGPGSGTRRYLVQRDTAGSSEPEWLAEGPLALPVPRRP